MQRLLDAFHQLVHKTYPGGAEALAPRLGKRPTTLSHEVRPPAGSTAKLGLLDALEIMELTDSTPMQLMCAHFGGMFVPLPQQGEGGEVTASYLVRLAKEFGDAIATISDRSSDGHISDNDARDIQRECLELMAAINATLHHIQARNLAGKPMEHHLRAVA
jgi:hypothetical protein